MKYKRIDPTKLEYYTAAAWMRGYVSSITNDKTGLQHKLERIAELLQNTWDDYAKESGYESDYD